MITVRFPSGLAVTYNQANMIEWASDFASLKNKGTGQLFATVNTGGGAIIEWNTPCEVKTPSQTPTLDSASDLTLAELRRVRYEILVSLKEELEKFNRQTGKWRD